MKTEGHQKNILFISSWYPSQFNALHGIFIKRHAKALSLFRPVCVLHAIGIEENREELKNPLRTYIDGNLTELIVYYKKPIGKNTVFLKISKWLEHKRAIDEGLQVFQSNKKEFAQIWLNVFFPAGITALYIKRKLNVPLISLEHWTGYQKQDGNYKGLVKKLTTKICNFYSKCIITISEDLKKIMTANRINNNYFIVNNIVDQVFFETPIRVKVDPEFFHISSLDERQKNIKLLMNGFANAQKTIPTIKLHIIGDSRKKEELCKIISELSLENNILFHGEKSGGELVKIIEKSTALILTSRYENMPVVISEALALGKPVISTRVGGIPEHINEERGILFTNESVEELSSAIIEMISRSSYNPIALREYAKQQFSENKVGEKLYEISKRYG